MPAINVYEPPGCCSTGLCGPEADKAMAEFAAALDWAKKQGLEVNRYNLSHQPAAFVENQTVKAALDQEGMECLPLVMVDGEVIGKGQYLDRAYIASKVGLDAHDNTEQAPVTSGGSAAV